ncbi:MAG: hypothetical protein ACE5I7_13455, partial [Candidatus Binatia bacterium]
GGGSKKTDCVSEWSVGLNATFTRRGKPSKKLVCKDGQGSCDTDSTAGQCTFSLAICANAMDPRLPKCAPSSITEYTVLKPRPDAKNSTDAANAANLLAAIELLGANSVSGKHVNVVTFAAPLSANTCTGPIAVTVPLKPNGKQGKKVLRVRAIRADGKKDTDSLKLLCAP